MQGARTDRGANRREQKQGEVIRGVDLNWGHRFEEDKMLTVIIAKRQLLESADHPECGQEIEISFDENGVRERMSGQVMQAMTLTLEKFTATRRKRSMLC